MQLQLADAREVIAKSLVDIAPFFDHSGLLKTFRVDYSEECKDDYINEEAGTIVDTRYDHAFAMEILLRLRGYFPSEASFLKTFARGLKVIFDDAILAEYEAGSARVNTLQWRYYNLPHQGYGKILPDIDDTGRCLILIERVGDLYGSQLLNNFTSYPELIHSAYNYRQFQPLMRFLDGDFRQCPSKGSAYAGLVTYFGEKRKNDVDPVCNTTALYSTLLFFNKNPTYLGGHDIEYISTTLEYLYGFLKARALVEAHEYYEPSFVLYNMAKLVELYESLGAGFRSLIPMEPRFKPLLEKTVLGNIKTSYKNPLEAAFNTTSLMTLGCSGPEVVNGIHYILETKKDGNWRACRFYRQRHPYRLFGSRGLTTIACLESLKYWCDSSSR